MKNKTRKGLAAIMHTVLRPLQDAKRAARIGAAGAWRRLHRETTFIGITGSHGKTTATALLGAILEAAAPTKLGIHNNASRSVARTLFSMSPGKYRYCVQEISAFPRGEIDKSAWMLRPRIGIVTAIGGDHRQEYRTFEATAAEKSKLVHRLPADGLAVLNGDDPLVDAMAAGCKCRVVRYGSGETADLHLLKATSTWPDRLALDVVYRGKSFRVATQLVGAHWQVSVMAALLTALELGISREACLAAIAARKPIFNKMSVHPAPGGASFVLDCTKLSYHGIEACLGFMKDAAAPRRSVVLGTISDHAGGDRRHYNRVAKMALAVADRVIFTGKNAPRVRRLVEQFPGRLHFVEDQKQAAALILDDLLPGEVVYLKAAGNDELHRVFPVER